MKKQDLQKKSISELTKHVAKVREELATMQRDKYLNDEKNTAKKRMMKREIAQALTRINNDTSESKAEKKESADTKENK